MIASNRLSSKPASAAFVGGRQLSSSYLADYETGGIAINDANLGLNVQVWRGRYIGNDLVLDVPDNLLITPQIVLTAAGVTEFSFTFDQLMRPVIAYVQNYSAKLHVYNNDINDFEIIDYGDVITNPRVAIDDKRDGQLSNSDVIFAYINNGRLYFRQQRDRFLIAYYLGNMSTLHKIGMNAGFRLQFEGEQ